MKLFRNRLMIAFVTLSDATDSKREMVLCQNL
jgi:hypothetical protein